MKKTWNIVSNVLVWVLVIAAVGMMIFTLISVNTFDQADRNIFGYKFFIVRSDSMSATDFNAGDIVFIKNVDPSVLKTGDIIAFTSKNSDSSGETITHKIREVTTDAQGNPAFVTYGTTTDTDDEALVTYPHVIGKYVGRIPKIGTFFHFLKTTPGYILCIFVPFLLLILYQGFNCVQLFRKYQKEQLDELEAEREKVAKERKLSIEMMKELQTLKEQLAIKDEQTSEQERQISEQ